MQEKNPANPKQHEPGQRPSRQPGSTPEPRKDFPGKAPDVYGDNPREGQNPARNQGDPRRDDSAGKSSNPGHRPDERGRDQTGSGQKPGAGRNPNDR